MSNFKTLAFAGLLLGVAHAAVAKDAAPAAIADPDPTAVPAATYALEPSHTRVLFSVSHMGFTTWYGDFTGASGTLKLDPRHAAGDSVEVNIPVASVSTTNATLDAELKGPEWFATAAFPSMTFASRKVTISGPGRAIVVGDLTLHGVTRPVTLLARFNGAGVNPLDKAYTVGFEAVGKLRRSDFGVAKYVPMVGDDVTLFISAAFERKP